MGYFDFLKSVYAKTMLPVFIADMDGKVLWASNAGFGCDNLSTLFQDNIFPAKGGVYSGMRGSCGYNYHLLQCGNGGESYVVLEVLSLDVLSDLLSLGMVRDSWINYDAKLRQAISGIYTAGDTLYGVLDSVEHYLEMDSLNIQLGNCYRILKANLPISEIMKYSLAAISEKVIPLADFFRKFGAAMEAALKCAVEVSADTVSIFADEERLTYAIINGIMLLTNKFELQGKRPAICLNASEVAGDVLISMRAYTAKEEAFEKVFSPTYLCNDKSFAGDEGIYAYVLSLFCKRFGGTLYLNGSAGVGIRLPKTEKTAEEWRLHSAVKAYEGNRFSPILVAFGNMYGIKFY